ncbi:MAG: HAD family hydrolase [Methylophilales bacterium 16-45-9]|nr:MAG: HAD family hydrolase [Methylophilales bacterium 16-45-9]
MQIELTKYKSIVFDCDGVVLDSNIVKTDAYFRTAKNLGATDAQAQALVDYHVRLGGISRYHKFDWYLREVLHQPATAEAIQTFLDEFSRELEVGLMHCPVAKGLDDLRTATSHAKWMILSGGDQQEIRNLFAKRATRAGLDFVFLSDWTEVADWQDYCVKNSITTLPRLSSLLT